MWPFLLNAVAPTIDHSKPLSGLRVVKIIDVGANRGQFALFARTTWPSADILCFEPLPEPCGMLRRLFANANVEIRQIALSDATGTMPMYVTKSDDSSSLLQIGTNQKRLSNTVVDHIEETISVDTLDNALSNLPLPIGTLLKIDVQGNEAQVLRGAVTALPTLSWVYVECSFQELYVGQSLASAIIVFMDQNGFELSGVFNQTFDTKIGAIQADFLFTNRIAPLNLN